MTILAVTGLAREARLVATPGVTAVVGGGRRDRLESRLEEACASARAIISIGLAGALAPNLRPGALVVARAVLAGPDRIDTDAAWADAALRRLPDASAGAVLGSDEMMTQAAVKQAAFAASGALAVDMESHLAAQAAQRAGLPFAAIRVISDAADRDLPSAVRVGMTPDGGMALAPVLLALARDPRQLPALIRTGREAETAFRALADARRLLGPGLSRPDLLELALDVG